MKKLLLIVAFLWVTAYGWAQTKPEAPNLSLPVPGQSQADSFIGPALHLLFFGNDYTYVNDFPFLLAQLAASGRHQIFYDILKGHEFTLGQFSISNKAFDMITGEKRDYVILQDQSVNPALEEQRKNEFYPAVRYLDEIIDRSGAKTLLFMTWGHQKGMYVNGFNDFESMQTQVTKGYMDIAQEMKLPVAPVGEAFRNALRRDASAALWGPDGSNPSLKGSYLTACVFYAVLYKTSPVGLEFTAGLSKEQARAMQTAAAETVLTDPSRWNIP
jgi:hypothetical protein